ncbi:MAG: hypothetical protein R8N24_01160 [Alphaproteobacteria bacterium]|nr:hypothetical protein [Alphaproteobacteria bacterium]
MTNKLKFALGVFALFPCIANADALDDKIAELTRQKLDKIAQLEQCQKSTQGLKIAGITTLGISTIGIAANIGEAVKIKKLDGELSSIETQKKDLQNKIAAAKKKEEERKRAALLAPVAKEGDDGNGNPGGDEDKIETVITPTPRAHHDRCTAEEIAQMSNGGLGVKTAWWSVSENKCAARTCKDGYYLVLENGESQGWCRYGCNDMSKFGQIGSYTLDSREDGGACETAIAETSALNKDTDALESWYNVSAMIWQAVFPYGYINGDATCVSEAEYGQSAGSLNSADVVDNDFTAGLTGNDSNGNERGLCFCRMTEPANSKWVFRYSSDAADCSNDCASVCGIYADRVVDWRRALFGAIR